MPVARSPPSDSGDKDRLAQNTWPDFFLRRTSITHPPCCASASWNKDSSSAYRNRMLRAADLSSA